MNDADYRKEEGVSNTMLGYLAKSPAHLQAYLASPPEPTDELVFGQLFHAALLEPETAFANVAVRPEGLDGRTKEGKAWAAEHTGKPIISWKNHQAILGMIRSVEAIPNMVDALAYGMHEQALFAEFALGGTVRRKGKLDLITKGAAIIDFKTTTNASKDGFAKAIGNYGYARQAAYYLDLCKDNGMDKSEFVFVAVEKEPPYCAGVYVLDQDSIAWGRKQYIELLQRFMQCRDSGEWPGYPTEPTMISLPQWAMREQAA
jgi:hypothetical protein